MPDHYSLVCPDVTSFQLRLAEVLDYAFTGAAITLMQTDNADCFDYFRLKTDKGMSYIVQVLHIKTIKHSWNHLFYML